MPTDQLTAAIDQLTSTILEMNPYHDSSGRFATAPGATYVNLWGKGQATRDLPKMPGGQITIDKPETPNVPKGTGKPAGAVRKESTATTSKKNATSVVKIDDNVNKEDRATITKMLRKIPADLVPAGMSVGVAKNKADFSVEYSLASGHSRGVGNAVAFFSESRNRIVISPEVMSGRLSKNKRLTPEAVVAHELGHSVSSATNTSVIMRGGGRSGGSPERVFQRHMHDLHDETRKVSEYAATSREEGWAEAFGHRLAYGTSPGPRTEAMFKRLGV